MSEGADSVAAELLERGHSGDRTGQAQEATGHVDAAADDLAVGDAAAGDAAVEAGAQDDEVSLLVTARDEPEAQQPTADAPIATALRSQSPPRTPSPARCPLTATLADLFGDFIPHGERQLIDPRHYDAETMIEEVFGHDLTEFDVFHDVHLETEMDDHHLSIIQAARREHDLQPLNDVFGAEVLETGLLGDLAQAEFLRPSIASCVRPDNPLKEMLRSKPGSKLWLLELPSVQPNRQTLHVDSDPFAPRKLEIPQNSPRAFYTPQNVIRWAQLPDGRKLSNARFVTWSDGSHTLHVGSDVYELLDNHERNLAVVTSRARYSGDDEVPATDASVESVQFDKHAVAVAARGAMNSVNEALVYEKVKASRDSRPTEVVQFLLNGVPAMRSQKELNATRGALSAEEEFMNALREQRKKEIERAIADGAPYTSAEIIAMELQDLETVANAVRDATLDDLLNDRRTARDVEKAERAQRTLQRKQHQPSSKFARSTALQTMDGSGEAVVDYEGMERGYLLPQHDDDERAQSQASGGGRRARSGSDDEDIGHLLQQRDRAARPIPPEYSSTQ